MTTTKTVIQHKLKSLAALMSHLTMTSQDVVTDTNAHSDGASLTALPQSRRKSVILARVLPKHVISQPSNYAAFTRLVSP
jgi:hypothetical protein